MIKKYFKKAGGLNLLCQYWRTGVLIPAAIQFLLTGRSKTALEMLRMFVSMKVQQRLKKKYCCVLKQFNSEYIKQEHIESRKLWIFWWQGMVHAPQMVQLCHESVMTHLGLSWDVRLITEQNYQDYVTFPEHINQKVKNGEITLTHFSDLLRLELLIRYGGLWLDATVLCTSGNIPQSILNADLFVYQSQKPGANGKATIMSSWLIYAKTNNRILMATRELLYAYWKRNTKMDDYFLLHQFFTIACQHYPEEAKDIPPFCNSLPHILLLHLADDYDEVYWNDLQHMTNFHKLSYKKEILDDIGDIEKPRTYYNVIKGKMLKTKEN